MGLFSNLFKPTGYNQEISDIINNRSLSVDDVCKAISTILGGQSADESYETSKWVRPELAKRFTQRDFIKLSLYMHAMTLGGEAAAVNEAGQWKIAVNADSKGELKGKPFWIEEYFDPQGKENMVIRPGEKPPFCRN